ncbi:hypothetical protein QTI66_27605 [Variovorax sp. J22R133]|uniref:hypothetical protein n=1 Tax=Variovorax brevis TaxID=3053503 RepID=UPI002578AD40|nr:hypothetical protein [Variovorax sp. J22R133]MDM0115946.1 hypothetical protein [Variovorax sp. J22R133]
MHRLFPAGVALALTLPIAAVAADPSSDVDALRKEISSMRADYESRLQALEKRVQDAEAKAAWSPPAVTNAPATAGTAGTAGTGATAAATATTATTGGAAVAATGAAAAVAPPPTNASPATVAAAPGSGGGSANSFNPAISLILSGGYTRTTQDPANFAITGFPLPPDAEIGPGTRGFNLGESELGFSASIDPWWRGQANIAVASDNSVSVEEAFVETTALGSGLSLRGGRFFSNIGYLNPQHAHTWDFVDAPLAYQAMLGTQYGDDGLQLKWVAPIDQYVELGAEVGRGRTFPGSDTSQNGAGMTSLSLHTGGDVGVSNSWRAGISVLNAKATDQSLLATNAAGAQVTNLFSGNSRVWILDGVWKWAPNGNATRTNFKLQGEYVRSDRDGNLVYDVGNTDSPSRYGVVQSGWYLQGIYQFMPNWRVGLRTEQLDPGTPDYGLNSGAMGITSYRPKKNSLMLDYNPSEFSRIRLQLAQDRSREGAPDNQIFLQYQMSLGAHGAHNY